MLACDCEQSRNQCAAGVLCVITGRLQIQQTLVSVFISTLINCAHFIIFFPTLFLSLSHLSWGSVNHFPCLLGVIDEADGRRQVTARRAASYQHHVCEFIPLTLKGAVHPQLERLLLFTNVTWLVGVFCCSVVCECHHGVSSSFLGANVVV